MKQLIRNLLIVSLIFILIFAFIFLGVIHQEEKSRNLLQSNSAESKYALKEIYQKAGNIYDRNLEILAESKNGERTYASDPSVAAALVQVIGDYTQNITNTVEERYRAELIGSNRGGFAQFLSDLKGHGLKGYDLRLTVDTRLVRKAAELLEGYTASLVLLNYQTGEILAVANTPLISPEQVIEYRDIKEGSLFNKAFLARYAPGSTFKVVTDLAWIASREFTPDFQVDCLGASPLLGPGSVLENRVDAGHGKVNRENGLALSCNHFFGKVAVTIGAQQLIDTAENFAFNKEYSLDKISVSSSILDLNLNIDDFVLSWYGIGQAIEGQQLELSPLHLALISAAVANEGKMMQPKLLLDMSQGEMVEEDLSRPEIFAHVAEPWQMKVLEKDMIYSVENGLAQSAKISGEEVGGKTGTAQYNTVEGDLANNSLFTGFLKNPTCPLAIGIVIEGENPDISVIAAELMKTALDIN